MSDTQELIEKLTNAVSFKFKEDGTRPNLTISRLRTGYYCSVVRFPKDAPKGKTKVVVCKAEANTLAVAVEKVAMAFLKIADPQPDPLQELASQIKQMPTLPV